MNGKFILVGRGFVWLGVGGVDDEGACGCDCDCGDYMVREDEGPVMGLS